MQIQPRTKSTYSVDQSCHPSTHPFPSARHSIGKLAGIFFNMGGVATSLNIFGAASEGIEGLQCPEFTRQVGHTLFTQFFLSYLRPEHGHQQRSVQDKYSTHNSRKFKQRNSAPSACVRAAKTRKLNRIHYSRPDPSQMRGGGVWRVFGFRGYRRTVRNCKYRR
ncbi:hypothetical protein BJX99DRAFT_202781 [Aspergillus californicus]